MHTLSGHTVQYFYVTSYIHILAPPLIRYSLGLLVPWRRITHLVEEVPHVSRPNWMNQILGEGVGHHILFGDVVGGDFFE